MRDLVLQGLRERWGEYFDAAFNGDLDNLDANYLARGAEVVVVEHSAGIVAAGILVPDGESDGRLVRVSVAPTHRRQGLARGVVAELVERARRRGMSQIRVLTDTPWTSAVELYRACGFTEVDSDDLDTRFVLDLAPTEIVPR